MTAGFIIASVKLISKSLLQNHMNQWTRSNLFSTNAFPPTVVFDYCDPNEIESDYQELEIFLY
ncbi:MAG: hypothetical protein ACFFDF_10355 [Candidatus Odinarchaeota archaeon]